jgi:RING-variant domain
MAADLRKPREQDIEMGPSQSDHAADGDTSDESDNTGSLCFSDAEDHPWRDSPHSASPNNPSISPYDNTDTASPGAAAVADPCRKSCVSDCSLETDLESGLADPEINKGSPSLEKEEKNCRICHLSLLEGSGPETGTGIVLGCSCKDDLAAAHRQCAETWFKIKGNK